MFFSQLDTITFLFDMGADEAAYELLLDWVKKN